MIKPLETTMKKRAFLGFNRRQKTLTTIIFSGAILLAIVIGNAVVGTQQLQTSLDMRNLSPSLEHLFGTDWLGRDMFARTIKGLALSLGVGVLASTTSALVALVLGLMAATLGKKVDALISWLVDLFLSVPHLVALILISFALGGGMKGVILGITFTHWPSLTRIIRAEVLQLRNSEFVEVSRQFGKSPAWIAIHHILPHLAPQLFVGLVLLFPHAVLHEAAITFLGFGLSPQQPAIGIILSESMRYLSIGMWWLAFFPGLALLIMVRSFDVLGDNVYSLMDPYRGHE
ncbi:ABC transporter permease [Alkalibacter rhizosphaerae]|uniref:ABC transporter permease n=1 Tax=Alkalibacter rhizosphaerae TaxID=2815577 RepID=A0A974XER9_9FIRM|nr:ABC transporter permease [Alkalibacter rhizosphaerae]QSX08517.1 ABC transporter permease [Alkalibacter rhizosphaerae]